MKPKKKLMPWEHEPWEEKRKKRVRTKRQYTHLWAQLNEGDPIIFTGTFSTDATCTVHIKGEVDFGVTLLDNLILGDGKDHTRKWNGVKLKQVEHESGEGFGSWEWIKRRIKYAVGPLMESTVYHELGHCFNGDTGTSFFLSSMSIILRERSAWMMAFVIAPERMLDFMIEDANHCLEGYCRARGATHIPITRQDVLRYRDVWSMQRTFLC